MSIEQDVLESVRANVYRVLDTVREYESDTFSASASKLSREEVVSITVSIINHALENLAECNTLDGVRLTEELDNIRPEED